MSSKNGQQNYYLVCGLNDVFQELKDLGYKIIPDPTDEDLFWSNVPCRPDPNPSLGIREREDGNVELWDERGFCDTRAIAKKLRFDVRRCEYHHLPLKDLLARSVLPSYLATKGWKFVAAYPYCDAEGNAVCEKVRIERTVVRDGKSKREKKFLWGRLVGDDKYIPSLKPCRTGSASRQDQVTHFPEPVRPGLYLRPELEQALKDRPDDPVFVVEGEKDVATLRKHGYIATCCPGSEKPKKAVSSDLQALFYGRDVVSLPDNDETGRKYSGYIEKLLLARATVRVVELPGLDEKEDISDWFAAGGTEKQLDALIAETEPVEAKTKVPLEPVGDLDGLPVVVLTDNPTERISQSCEEPIIEAKVLYVRGSQIVCLGTDANDETILLRCTPDRLARIVERHTRPCKLTRDGLVSAPIPRFVVADMLANSEPPYRPVKGIARTPIPKPNGDICFTPGYDAETQLIYAPTGIGDITIPDKPTKKDIRAAIKVALGPFEQMPYVDDASRTNTLAALCTPILHPVIDGSRPAIVVDATDVGTGKSRIVATISTIVTGHPDGSVLQIKREMDPVITAALVQGSPVVCFDNVAQPVDQDAFASVLTSRDWNSRRYNRNDETINVPNNATFFITGNNVQVGGDMPRRCVWIRLDAKTYQPFRRTGFRIKNLIEYAQEHRTEIIRAVLILWRAWVVAGSLAPSKDVPILGGFEEWRHIIGGMFEFAGVIGLLGNADDMYEQSERESAGVAAFLYEWYRYEGWRETSTNGIHQLCVHDAELLAVLPERVATWWDRGNESCKRSMGKLLASIAGKVHEGDLIVARAGYESHSKRQLWRVGLAKGCKDQEDFTPKKGPAPPSSKKEPAPTKEAF